ncbi:hypothetical protein CFO_g732 [Ceratocystis platani]|uniref:RNA helicase HEL117 n=1 Tax=Ceratocystis fimbriata f. sp. platani TaxID=88771 RepID=A0A0F8B7K7_CERFI|nr:hypothetical protein CFO_g732 [Ceratocystis platani]
MGNERRTSFRASHSPRRSHRRYTRSRSPRADDHDHSSHRSRRSHRTRDRTHDRRHDTSGSHKHRLDTAVAPVRAVELPFEARPLHKRDFKAFLPLFAYYLDLQKQKDLSDMDEREAKGRWKSFLGKWNRGELAEGWYDPVMFERSKELYGQDSWSFEEEPEKDGDATHEARGRTGSYDREGSFSLSQEKPSRPPASHSDSDSDPDDVGPAPAPVRRSNATPHGASVPSLSDLELRDQARLEDRQASIDDLRYARKQDRILQKERLEELVPRADPGSRERKLEKKSEIREKLRAVSPGGGVPEHDDNDLIGGGDSLAELKRAKESAQRKKTEREKRREEIWRAREAEREERAREYREKEDATVRMLREFARNRGGAGSGL